MRILQLVHSLKTGGAEILSDRIGRHMAKKHNVVFACLDEMGELGQSLLDDGFTVHLIGRDAGTDFACIKRLREVIRKESIDVVHAHQYTPFFYAACARGLSRSPRILFTEHGRFHPDTPSIKRGVFNRVMLSRNDRVLAVGNQVRQALIKNEYIPSRRVQVIYNGIDLAKFGQNNKEDTARQIRSELQLTDESFVICQVARLDHLKDHITAVRAMAEVTDKNAILIIIGEGPEEKSIKAEIQKLNIQSKVRLIGLRRDIPRLLAASNALLLTSISEGIPLTLIEGMACGLPIVSTNVGGVSEVVTNNENGFLAPPRNPSDIAKAIQKLIVDHQLGLEMGIKGKRVAKEKFSESNMLAAYDELL